MSNIKKDRCPTCCPEGKHCVFDATGTDEAPTWTCRNCLTPKPRRIMRARRARRAAEFKELCDSLGIDYTPIHFEG